MHARWSGLGLALALLASNAVADEITWRSARPDDVPARKVSLGRPQPLQGVAETPTPPRTAAPVDPPARSIEQASYRVAPWLVRAQAPDSPPPPPPFPGTAGGPVSGGPVSGGPDPYSCAPVNNDADLGGFWSKCGDKLKRCWGDTSSAVTGVFTPQNGRNPFQSSGLQQFPFISPVSNPIYFEDPRAITEVRPIFIWQSTPSSNTVFAGGDNYILNLQGRLAVTEWMTIVIHKLGITHMGAEGSDPNIQSATGFSDLYFGPKFTFYKSEATGTVMAAGGIFELPVGSGNALQGTGNLSITPYFSLAQSFWRSSYGTFNFLNTTGYEFSIDSQRTDAFYSSFHLDYDVGNAHVFYPLVEMNWWHYTMNGSARNLDFDGSNLFNMGSNGPAGLNELTLAIGGRYKFSEAIQLGLVGEFGLIRGARHLDDFRVTFDMIFRY
jgi:hypothetical protein